MSTDILNIRGTNVEFPTFTKKERIQKAVFKTLTWVSIRIPQAQNMMCLFCNRLFLKMMEDGRKLFLVKGWEKKYR